MFDLFGTLVEDAREEIYPEMARVLGLQREEFRRRWGKFYPERTAGKMTFAGSIAAMGFEGACVEEAARIRTDEVARGLSALRPGALELLEGLTVPFGLLSNASVEVPELWPASPLARFFPRPLFSCEVGLMKPQPEIYRLACERLGRRPEECLFVGDGGDDEHTGAAAAGMTPVQVENGRPRADAARFVITSLYELTGILRDGTPH